MNPRCKQCVCNILRQHYIKHYPKEYKEAISEWCKLNELDETIELNNVMKRNDTVICPGVSLFIKNCFQ